MRGMRRILEWCPLMLGTGFALIVWSLGGSAATGWFALGVFVGGYVPLYLMPWIRRRAGR